jgi:hypothetical protein
MAHHSWPRIPGKGIGYTCICLAISPFLVGFSAEDSTGWSVGAGVSRSRTQYVTGCTPKYYSMRQTEIDARIEYVHAKTPERAWSPAIQVQAAAGGIRTQRTLLAEALGGSINLIRLPRIRANHLGVFGTHFENESRVCLEICRPFGRSFRWIQPIANRGVVGWRSKGFLWTQSMELIPLRRHSNHSLGWVLWFLQHGRLGADGIGCALFHHGTGSPGKGP